MWTRFVDMHSGGTLKEPYATIYIEAPETEAVDVFERYFNRNPNNVTCECCGNDYHIDEDPTLEQATAYDRGCAYDKESNAWVERPRDDHELVTLDDYLKRNDVLVIYKPFGPKVSI